MGKEELKIKIGKTYKMDFGWNFTVVGFKDNKIESGAWKDETLVKGLRWNDSHGEDTKHEAYAKIAELVQKEEKTEYFKCSTCNASFSINYIKEYFGKDCKPVWMAQNNDDSCPKCKSWIVHQE